MKKHDLSVIEPAHHKTEEIGRPRSNERRLKELQQFKKIRLEDLASYEMLVAFAAISHSMVSAWRMSTRREENLRVGLILTVCGLIVAVIGIIRLAVRLG